MNSVTLRPSLTSTKPPPIQNIPPSWAQSLTIPKIEESKEWRLIIERKETKEKEERNNNKKKE